MSESMASNSTRYASPLTGAEARTRRSEFPALPPRLTAGDVLGEFRVTGEIRIGSHSSVFRAVSQDDGRRVALKVLSAQLAFHREAVHRFCAEAALAERVSHPGIVPVYGSGCDRGHYFYAMSLESGATLGSLATEAVTHPTELEHYTGLAQRFAGVVRAVAFLHECSIVHRDIKPTNILIDGEGRFLLCDFGCALDAEERDPNLESAPGGTVLYMSPEQLAPGADPYDPLADVYSLGLTLYELATGTLPLRGTPEAEIARSKLTRRTPPPRRLNPHLPMALEAIIREAIDVPALRYPSAEAMARDLDRFGRRVSRRR